MKGLIQNYQLTLPAILKRAEELYSRKEIVTRNPDKSFHRYTYADFVRRSKKLAVALGKLGLEKSDRVVTIAWNTYQHLEAYFGVPSAGLVLHTLNPRLSFNDLTYIINHADDRVLLIDETLVELLDGLEDEVDLERIFVFSADGTAPEGLESYEDLLEGTDENDFEYPNLNENDAAALCYTSGTTGRPKGALYSHRSISLHSMALAMADGLGLGVQDCVLPVVPMFHVNAWGLPFASTMVGAKQVMPGPHLDPESLRELVVGGSAAPESMIRGFEERHGLRVVHAWGMTEMNPVGTVCRLSGEMLDAPKDEQYKQRAKQGPPLPFIELRARGDEGFVPWDGETMGELEVRGPWIANSYFNTEEGAEKFTDDGWFTTGDVVTIDESGYVEIRDRDKDLVKSGGEWISSVDLENALMGHEDVAEAAVIAIPHEKWDERPLAVVVLKEGADATQDDLLSYLEGDFAKWQLPDAVEFVDEIPRTATGKFLKMELREQFK